MDDIWKGQAGHKFGQSLCQWQSSHPLPVVIGEKNVVFAFTLDIPSTHFCFVSKTTEICKINCSSPIYFALFFAAATAKTTRSFTFKKELQPVFKHMRKVFIYKMNLKLYQTTNSYSLYHRK